MARDRRAMDAGIGGLVQAGPVGCFIRSPVHFQGCAQVASLSTVQGPWQPSAATGVEPAAATVWSLAAACCSFVLALACGTGMSVSRRGGSVLCNAPRRVPHGAPPVITACTAVSKRMTAPRAPVFERATTALRPPFIVVRAANRTADSTAAPPCGKDCATAVGTRLAGHVLWPWAVECPGDHTSANPLALQFFAK